MEENKESSFNPGFVHDQQFTDLAARFIALGEVIGFTPDRPKLRHFGKSAERKAEEQQRRFDKEKARLMAEVNTLFDQLMKTDLSEKAHAKRVEKFFSELRLETTIRRLDTPITEGDFIRERGINDFKIWAKENNIRLGNEQRRMRIMEAWAEDIGQEECDQEHEPWMFWDMLDFTPPSDISISELLDPTVQLGAALWLMTFAPKDEPIPEWIIQGDMKEEN